MTSARILTFTAAAAAPREAVSPFRHLMPARPLTAREILHRQRMVAALTVASRSMHRASSVEHAGEEATRCVHPAASSKYQLVPASREIQRNVLPFSRRTAKKVEPCGVAGAR